ncbi:BPI fold containing family A member 2 [Phyllostomus discolor]|uniref:BPI fold containing family A member 2 n=1 Tax=Phyllostomus discolor TaxID=89673 RepID=A0A833YZM6_9CHIR|nr:BPI fold containing family A member 2 [Phyllostomus discolor]
MFQLWKLVLLCGLLTGTSASILGDIGSDLKDVIDKGRELIGDTVETVAGDLKEDLTKLQNSKVGQLSEQVLQKAENLFSDAVSKVLSIGNNILGLKISNVNLLGIKPGLTPDGEGLGLSLPITADVELNLPLIGKTVDLKLSMDLLAGAKIETEDGKPIVAITKCNSDPASISLSLLDRHSKLVNRLVDAVTTFLSQTLSTTVEMQVCPLVRLFLNTLGVNFLQDTINGLKQQSSA